MRSASHTATERPAAANSHAMLIPAIPPPTTATSASTSPVTAGYEVGSVESIQYDSASPANVVIPDGLPAVHRRHQRIRHSGEQSIKMTWTSRGACQPTPAHRHVRAPARL